MVTPYQLIGMLTITIIYVWMGLEWHERRKRFNA
jgi:hypothetical protein